MNKKMKYCCVVREHKTSNEYITNIFNTQENCLLYIEEYIQNYIGKVQGEICKVKYFRQTPVHEQVKEGCFVICEEYLKYAVYDRVRDIGYVWNSFEDNKLFTISMCKMKNTKNYISKRDDNKDFEKESFNRTINELSTKNIDNNSIDENLSRTV